MSPLTLLSRHAGPPPRRQRPARVAPALSAVLLGTLLLAAGTVHAQSQDRASREREALRRSQQALQQLRDEHTALQTELGTLRQARETAQAEQQRQGASLGQKEAALRRLREEQTRLGDERARLQAELDTLRQVDQERQTRLARDAEQLRQQQAALEAARSQSQGLQAALDERTRANQALVARLEALTATLAGVQRQHEALHTLARQAARRLGSRTADDEQRLADPLFGVAAVRSRDESERLLLQIDALRPGSVPPATATATEPDATVSAVTTSATDPAGGAPSAVR
ncbi:MAG: hypothetical protein RLY78_343 [Pseudomonadota bacterium]|jgi:chromosome segregation protein